MKCSEHCTKNCPYSEAGQAFYKRQGHCPYADLYFDETQQEAYLKRRVFRKLKGIPEPGWRSTMWDWMNHKAKMKLSQTPGKQKTLQCQSDWLKRTLAKRSRSYKLTHFRMWKDIFSKR